MNNRSRVMSQQWVPVAYTAAFAAPAWCASVLVAPHVSWAASFFDGWLAAFSIVSFVAALILTGVTAVRFFIALEFTLGD